MDAPLFRARDLLIGPRRSSRSGQAGFSLIEILVVILIVGILAAIALPAFLGHQTKAEDADAKSLARNAVSQVEHCANSDYTVCEEGDGVLTGTGLDPAGLDITSAGEDSFEVAASSESGNTFYITKQNGGAPVRSCKSADEGGCRAGAPAGAAAGADGNW